MATSGSSDFTRTRNQIVTDAFQLLNIYGANEVISSSDLAFGVTRLNAMIKAWQAMGINLWTMEEARLFLTVGQEKYTLGTSSDRSCLASDFVETTTSANSAAYQAVFDVEDSTGMLVSDVVGIVLDSGSIHWTTIFSVDSTTRITLSDAIPTAASSGAQVFTYTTTLFRPLKIHSVRRHSKGGIEVPLFKTSRQDYFNLSNKQGQGVPNQYYYDPQLVNGNFYVYQAPNDSTTYLTMTVTRSFEDFDDADNTPDFPQEWIDAITYNLCLRIAPAFGKIAEATTMFAPMATALLDAAKSWDTETASLYFQGGEN